MGFYDLFSLESRELKINGTFYLSSYSFKYLGNINMVYPILKVGVNALLSLQGRDTIGMSQEKHSLV